MEQKTGTNYLARIIEDVDLALKALEIVYRANGAAVEGLADRNGHIQKVVGEGKSVSWGGAWTKGKGNECELTKYMFYMFLHSDLLKLCLKKNTTSLSSSLTQLCFMIRKLALPGNGVNRQRAINQLNHNIHKFDLRQTLQKYLRTFLNEFEVLMILANGPIILEYQA